MATNKSTSKAKTKTSKKTSAAKTADKKPIVSEKALVKSKSINIQKIRSLHMISAGVFILLALLAVFLMGDKSYQLTIGYLTEDILSGELAAAVRVVYDVEVRWLLAVIMALSAILPVLYLGKWEKKYTDAVTNSRTVPWRWIDFAVTGALMMGTVALLSGVQDVMALKLIGGLIAGSFWLAWIAEKQNDGVSRPVWATYTAGVAAGVLPWIIILSSAIATVIYGAVWSPWYVYALYAITVAGAVSLACIQFTNYRRKLAAWQANYLAVERNYIAVNILTKAAFAIILIIGLR